MKKKKKAGTWLMWGGDMTRHYSLRAFENECSMEKRESSK